jgi:hypothetical protein
VAAVEQQTITLQNVVALVVAVVTLLNVLLHHL